MKRSCCVAHVKDLKRKNIKKEEEIREGKEIKPKKIEGKRHRLWERGIEWQCDRERKGEKESEREEKRERARERLRYL